MKAFSRSDTSTPNVQGFNTIPTVGYINDTLSSEKQSPFGDTYQINVYGIINQQATDINEVIVIDNLGSETPLQIVYVDLLPSELDNDKCYISNKSGFGGTIYFGSVYSNYDVKYKFGIIATTITVDMFNVMLPVGKIFTKIIPTEFSTYEKICNGQEIDPNVYPGYNAEIRKISNLEGVLWFADGRIKVPTYEQVVPLLTYQGTILDSAVIGSTNIYSYIPKAGFKTLTSSTNGIATNSNNRQGYNTIGSPKNRNGGTKKQKITIPSLSPDFNHFTSYSGRVKVSDDRVMPPNAPLYPFIIVR